MPAQVSGNMLYLGLSCDPVINKHFTGYLLPNLTYKADFGFSVFVNRLKNKRVSEGPSGLN